MVFLVMGWSAEDIEEKKNTGTRKTLKSEEKEKRRIRGKSNNNSIQVGVKLYFAQKQNLKRSCLYHQILFTVFMRCRIFETQ